MLCIANMKVPPVKLAPNQKVKTWKFAAKYLWKERFTEDKAELGRWTRDELLRAWTNICKIRTDSVHTRRPLSTRIYQRTRISPR